MPETRGQALEAIGENFLNHKSNVGSWAPVRVLNKLASRIVRRGSASNSGSSSEVSVAEISAEGVGGLENTTEPTMTGGLEEEVEAVSTMTPESPVNTINTSEEAIELGILPMPAAT